MHRNEPSFTLMELLIVVVIIGVIAGFAIPGYQKAMEKATEKNAIIKLQSIIAGMKIYRAKNGSYPAFDMPDLTSINTNLGLSVVPDTMSYYCAQNDGVDVNVCTARSPNDWRIHWHPLGGGADTIHCSNQGPACPSCPLWTSGSCG